MQSCATAVTLFIVFSAVMCFRTRIQMRKGTKMASKINKVKMMVKLLKLMVMDENIWAILCTGRVITKTK